jgi:DAACS family dicarboxylate/amino acid:cation (Na+ or H+) symporter
MKKLTVHTQLLIALVLGFSLGLSLHGQTDITWLPDFNQNYLQPLGQIFLRLIFMVVVPLVFSALVTGVYEIGSSRGLGRVAGRTLMFTAITSALSVVIGVGLVQIVKPGLRFSVANFDPQTTASQVEKITANASAARSPAQAFVELIPKNPMESALKALEGEMISLMVFALIFGIALSLTSQEGRPNPVIESLDTVMKACLKVVDFAMKLAPLAVFVIVFNTAFKFGLSIFGSLALYILVVVTGLLIQQFGVYAFLLKFFAGRSPLDFFRKSREVYLYAFSTASSNATLPRSLALAEGPLQLNKKISRFVLTVGSTANQNGTALFEGVTVLFLAQVYGIDLSLTQQIQVVAMSILAGIGTAGVPGGSLPLIVILLQSIGVPAEGIGIILGVDRFLDMCRTTINVSGDLVVAALVDQISDNENKVGATPLPSSL